MSKVYIVILNWNNWPHTIECLTSLLMLEYPVFRIVVCDNGSSDNSIEKLLEWGKQQSDWQFLGRDEAESGGDAEFDPMITLVDNRENLGFGAGTNVGLRYALARNDADYCWLLNNDTTVDPGALMAMVKRLADKSDAGMCGSTLRYYDNRLRIQALGGARYFKWLGVAWHIGRTIRGEVRVDVDSVEEGMDYIVGASLLISTRVLKDIGLLAEGYFLFFEELDLALRGKDYRLAYAPRSVVYHKIGATIGTTFNPRRKSYICDYYTLRNRILLTRKFFPEALIGVYAWLLVELFARVLVGRWDLARMVFGLLCHGGGDEKDLPSTHEATL